MSAILSWNTLYWALLVPYLVICILLVILVMMQKGKGGGFAGAFGVGPGSDAVLGPRMMRSLPIRLTYGFATGFMVLALVLTIINGRALRGAAPDRVTESAVLAGEDSTLPTGSDPLSNLKGLQGNPGDETPVSAPSEAPADTAAEAPAEPAAEAQAETSAEAPAEEPAATEATETTAAEEAAPAPAAEETAPAESAN